MRAQTARHRIDGDDVVISFDGKEPVRLAFTTARRLAWGLLVDLEPDEAEAAGMPRPRRRQGETDAVRILRALGHETLPARVIVLRSGVPTRFVSARLIDLRAQGLAKRVDAGFGRGVKALYAATPRGLQFLRESAS
ncbi:hypothetical protein LRS10_13670 [Phenylobacterium sp. J426]|uniref:hypothetical protein n=1 Tax=Phenylobacterium sp. J426 TaxID=2898439 RepID=UPI002151863D|nr:hypothetical protein [Phenylobacterium sp. J426]MCR5875142.1 hypothetical protein [Phenylobacterium sp. J426]